MLAAPTTQSMAAAGLAALAAQFAGVAALTGLNLGGNARTAEAVATLRSRAFTESFIREHNLMPILFADAWDAEAQGWRAGARHRRCGRLSSCSTGMRSIEEDVETGLYTRRR